MRRSQQPAPDRTQTEQRVQGEGAQEAAAGFASPPRRSRGSHSKPKKKEKKSMLASLVKNEATEIKRLADVVIAQCSAEDAEVAATDPDAAVQAALTAQQQGRQQGDGSVAMAALGRLAARASAITSIEVDPPVAVNSGAGDTTNGGAGNPSGSAGNTGG